MFRRRVLGFHLGIESGKFFLVDVCRGGGAAGVSATADHHRHGRAADSLGIWAEVPEGWAD